MARKPLPYGWPKYFEGKYKYNRYYPLFVQRFTCQFILRENYLPTLQCKNHDVFFGNEYLESNEAHEVELTMTSIDLELFMKHYEVYDIEWLDGYMFKQAAGLFEPYVNKWVEEKNKAKLAKNDGKYTIAKLMLNSVYGKMALNPKVTSKKPFLDDKGILHYRVLEPEYREPLHIGVGSFITAWARWCTITVGQQLYDRVIYFDTDSLHLKGVEYPKGIEISETVLGALKHEFTFEKAKYLRQKAYMAYGFEPDKPEKKFKKIACSGLPRVITKAKENEVERQNDDGTYNIVDFENFDFASVFRGGLKPTHVKGGIVLEPKDFTIRHMKVRKKSE